MRHISAIHVPRPRITSSRARKFLILGSAAIDPGIQLLDSFIIRPTEPLSWPHLPNGWEEQSSLFEQYRVVACTLTCSLIGATISDTAEIWGMQTMSKYARTGSFDGVDETLVLLERGMLPNGILIAGANRYTGMKSLQCHWNMKSWFPKGTNTDKLFAELTPLVNMPEVVTNPTGQMLPYMTTWYGGLHLTTNPASRRFQYKIELTVQFRKPVPFDAD